MGVDVIITNTRNNGHIASKGVQHSINNHTIQIKNFPGRSRYFSINVMPGNYYSAIKLSADGNSRTLRCLLSIPQSQSRWPTLLLTNRT